MIGETDIVSGRLDADGRLIRADPKLAALQAQAGGRTGGMLAVPQIAALARLAQRLGITVSRAAGIGREHAAAILLLANSNGPLVSGTEGDATAVQLELYDSLDRASAEEVLTLWRAAPGYRIAVARVSTRGRPAAEAA